MRYVTWREYEILKATGHEITIVKANDTKALIALR
jgi:hypothetical protein